MVGLSPVEAKSGDDVTLTRCSNNNIYILFIIKI
jgi:hypothetical protein